MEREVLAALLWTVLGIFLYGMYYGLAIYPLVSGGINVP